METEQDLKVVERGPVAVPVTAKISMNRGTPIRVLAGAWEGDWAAVEVAAEGVDSVDSVEGEAGDSDSGTEVKSPGN